MKLKSLKADEENGIVLVRADYEMPGVHAALAMTYLINNEGAVKVTEALKADKEAKVSPMFRFGMQMQLHSAEVKKADYTNLLIDLKQMGLGCRDSWGAWPLEEYLLPYGDYEFTFIMRPLFHQLY